MKYIIGIDAGVNCGVAVYNFQTKTFDFLKSMGFWTAFDYICINHNTADTAIHIEWLNTTGSLYAGRNRSLRMAANVGGVRRETALFADGIERRGFTVNRVARGRSEKWDQKMFTQVTGLTCKTNEHVRDAAKMALTFR